MTARFWPPNPEWFDKTNPTNVRTFVGIALAVVVVFVGLGVYLWAVAHAIPWTLDPCSAVPCLEPLGRQRSAEFAKGTLDALLIFVELLVGIAVGGVAVNRATDTAHKVDVELAKQGLTRGNDGLPFPAPVTGERPAQRARPSRLTVQVPAIPEAHEWREGEAHEGIL